MEGKNGVIAPFFRGKWGEVRGEVGESFVRKKIFTPILFRLRAKAITARIKEILKMI